MIRFIKLHRKDGNASFKLLTTGYELILVVDKIRKAPTEKSKQIRFNCIH